MSEPFIPKRPVVVSYPKLPEAYVETEQIVKFLRKQGFETPQGSIYDEELRKRVKAGEFDLLIGASFQGDIDDVRIYNRAVAPANIH